MMCKCPPFGIASYFYNNTAISLRKVVFCIFSINRKWNRPELCPSTTRTKIFFENRIALIVQIKPRADEFTRNQIENRITFTFPQLLQLLQLDWFRVLLILFSFLSFFLFIYLLSFLFFLPSSLNLFLLHFVDFRARGVISYGVCVKT